MSEKEKERHRQNSQRREVYQYDTDWNLIKVWPSTREAGRSGFNSSYISQVCRNGRKAYDSYWRYRPLDEENEDIRIEAITTISSTK